MCVVWERDVCKAGVWERVGEEVGCVFAASLAF